MLQSGSVSYVLGDEVGGLPPKKYEDMYIYVWTHMRVICVYFMDLNAHTLRTCVYINALLDIHMCTPCHIPYVITMICSLLHVE